MKFLEKHKAAIITLLLTGIVVLSLFSFQLKLKGKLLTESYYLIEPEEELTKEEQKIIEDLNKSASNKAFNEDEEYKEMMRNFKSISANDFERTTKELEEAKASETEVKEDISINTSSLGSDNTYALNANETGSYKKLQEQLNKRLENKKQAEAHAKTKSTLTYSLKGRTLTYSDNPRYLCEKGGKIVVSIHVNHKGQVFDAFINGASNSNNQCLIDHAIEYAKSVEFDTSSKTDQLGTITFLFSGKF